MAKSNLLILAWLNMCAASFIFSQQAIMNKSGYNLEVDIWSLGCTVIEMGTGRHPWHPHGDVPAMFKIVNTNSIPEIPESFSKEGKDFLSLCLKRDPAQRPSATQLLGHPFVQDHQTLRATKCSSTRFRNGLSLPAETWQNKSNKEPSSKRSIAPLRGIGGLRARGFVGFSSAYPSPNKASRANMSLPVSPCSSPLRRVKQSNWSCVASPSHKAPMAPQSSSDSHLYSCWREVLVDIFDDKVVDPGDVCAQKSFVSRRILDSS